MIHMRKAKSEFELHILALHVEFSTGLIKSRFCEFQTLET